MEGVKIYVTFNLDIAKAVMSRDSDIFIIENNGDVILYLVLKYREMSDTAVLSIRVLRKGFHGFSISHAICGFFQDKKKLIF